MNREYDNDELCRRLRGIYTIPVNDGGGLLNGKDTFTRKFDGLPPINEKAAVAIESLQQRVRQLEGTLQSLVDAIEKVSDFDPETRLGRAIADSCLVLDADVNCGPWFGARERNGRFEVFVRGSLRHVQWFDSIKDAEAAAASRNKATGNVR